ncbi:MAG: trypsin-like serine protease [Ruminococcaceae bacterium]|nr:trypsin-like serine protease [Oscillospiraceae bacterium]
MEERNVPCGEDRLPGEVVEIYRQAEPREVVSCYTRPLPGGHPAAKKPVTGGKKKQSKKGLWIFLACFAVFLLAVAAVTALTYVWARDHSTDDLYEYFTEKHEDSHPPKEVEIPRFPYGQGVRLAVGQTHGDALTPQEIYSRVNPSVVAVLSRRGDRASVGSGVIFTADGYVITNYHVVEGGQTCTVMLSTGYQYEAKYVAGDRNYDLAILKMETADLPAAEFLDSDLLTVGDPAYAIGNPMGYELLGTMTDGIISAVDREVEVDGRYMNLIQTNAALNTGNSGGPLVNCYGQVVGINVIKLNSPYSTVEGLGFAIPTAVMRRVVNDLLTYGEVKPEPLLGVSVAKVATQAAEGVWGLEVVELVEDGAADRAGVRVGDWLLSADGVPLTVSNDLLRVRRTHYLGEEMELVLWRGGEELRVTLELTQSAAE